MSIHTVRIHGPSGVSERHAAAPGEPRAAALLPRCACADQMQVSEIMTSPVECATRELPVAALLDLMIRERLGCVPVVDAAGAPIGMVTKVDLLECLAAPPPAATPIVDDMMMAMAITLDHQATIAHAALRLAEENVHHLLIVADGLLVGVVSTLDVTRWLARGAPLRS